VTSKKNWIFKFQKFREVFHKAEISRVPCLERVSSGRGLFHAVTVGNAVFGHRWKYIDFVAKCCVGNVLFPGCCSVAISVALSIGFIYWVSSLPCVEVTRHGDIVSVGVKCHAFSDIFMCSDRRFGLIILEEISACADCIGDRILPLGLIWSLLRRGKFVRWLGIE
jgi:hypothetical protein